MSQAIEKTEEKEEVGKSRLRENIEAIFIAILLALFIRTFIVQAFKIPSGSMLPTLQIGDQLLVNKFIYGVRMPFTDTLIIPISKPKPNDIIVFQYPDDPKIDFIKRVIAVGGDTVEIRNKRVFVNGRPFVDSHANFLDPRVLPEANSRRDNIKPFIVPDHQLFVMGDNRDYSNDGRFWGFVDLDAVRGKAWVIYWSWNLESHLFSLDRLSSIRWSRLGNTIY